MSDVVIFYVMATPKGATPIVDDAARNAALIMAASTGHAPAPGLVPARYELAKFFTEKDAQAYIATLGSTWLGACIEKRDETWEQQHPAHRPTKS